jgi:hypothetical protein
MAQGISLQQVSSVIGKALKTKSPQVAVTKEALGAGRAVSTDLFGYDFVGLAVKMAVFFAVAIIFSKFMEAVILTRGAFVTLANLFGWQIPTSEQIPESIKKLFDGGKSGFKFWDIVKIVAMLLVIAEFMRYVNTNRKAGSSSSPMTIGIFILIVSVLAVTSIPELAKRIKNTDFNLESLR